jgi:hypothetical protein
MSGRLCGKGYLPQVANRIVRFLRNFAFLNVPLAHMKEPHAELGPPRARCVPFPSQGGRAVRETFALKGSHAGLNL